MKRSMLVLLAALGVPGGAYAAYGPPPPSGGTSSGGFTHVAATATRGPDGGEVHALTGGTDVTVSIPAGSLSRSTQITLVAPNRARLAREAGPVLAAFAVQTATTEGRPLVGRIGSTPLTLTLQSPRIQGAVSVLVWSASRKTFLPLPRTRVTIAPGVVTVRFNRPSEFEVVPGR